MTKTSPTAARDGVAVPGQKRRRQAPGAGPFNNIRLTRDKPLQTLTLSGEKDLRLVPKTKADDTRALERRAKSKYLTQNLAVKLANVPGTSQSKGYWRTYHCSSVMQKQGDRMVARFCKCRWCLTCCNCRTAELLRDYLPILKSWPEKYLVTLTVVNCKAEELEATIRHMLAVMSKIRETLKKQHQRGQRAAQIVGFRKLEVTFSKSYRGDGKDYHPHFHLIVNDQAVAHDLWKLWLMHNQTASADGQNVKQADNNSAAEVMKYFTKIISRHSTKRVILVEQLNVIFEAVAGVRTFQTMGGIKVTKSTEADEQEADVLAEAMETEAVYEWQQAVTDWVNLDTGELLTGFEPSEQLRDLVEKRMIYTSTPPPPQKGS